MKEQLADTKKPATPVVEKKEINPRSMSLNKSTGKLLNWGIAAWANGNVEESSDEEEVDSNDSD